ncbi:IS3 family transposase [Vagococcus xieshaowenii]|uniref:Integrase catalytic domain-containing protein n=1 Tax=Vagococcus xieshaowenii TaxID=2562451 RepID=A0AAJ5EHC4_9ENTE|nr:IS3 family transposase [Vagococcus xieshaowenii]QCA28866.1 hypothetical protein E4Z98_05855 [Vagococcus xieshaowenii]TFZ43427.1 hypothetical protein E4031_00020 [Vagococcus xieshaowenii]
MSESTYKSFKMKFVYSKNFKTKQESAVELFDYVNRWKNWRLHGAWVYKTPEGYKEEFSETCFEGDHQYDTLR